MALNHFPPSHGEQEMGETYNMMMELLLTAGSSSSSGGSSPDIVVGEIAKVRGADEFSRAPYEWGNGSDENGRL